MFKTDRKPGSSCSHFAENILQPSKVALAKLESHDYGYAFRIPHELWKKKELIPWKAEYIVENE